MGSLTHFEFKYSNIYKQLCDIEFKYCGFININKKKIGFCC